MLWWDYEFILYIFMNAERTILRYTCTCTSVNHRKTIQNCDIFHHCMTFISCRHIFSFVLFHYNIPFNSLYVDLKFLCFFLTRDCLRFSFMDLLQKNLVWMMIDWNQHKIRSSRMAECPSGKPDLLYHLPQIVGKEPYI